MKTKTFLLLLFTFPIWGLGGFSCSEDNVKIDPIAQLTPKTQVGANTFGVTINGKVYVPRDPNGTLTGSSSSGMILWSNPTRTRYEIEIKDVKSAVGFQMFIHMQPLLSAGLINLFASNFRNNIDSTPFTHIYFKIWDSRISNYSYNGSIENKGELTITKLSNGVLSGTFKGKLIRYDNPNDFINTTDGRFDIGPNLHYKVFP